MKRYTTFFFALLLAIALLAACASPAPGYDYDKVVTPTEPPATSTPEATLTPTPRPDSKELAIAWVNLALTVDAQVDPQQMVDAICQMATEYGCWKVQGWDDSYASFYAKYPDVKSEPVIDSVTLKMSGVMSDGIEYQVWEVLGTRTNWVNDKTQFSRYPTFVWVDDVWKFHYSPDGPTAQTLQYCGQFWEYAPDGREYGKDDWPQVFADCQTATPLPPTPFVPVTPVFTPAP